MDASLDSSSGRYARQILLPWIGDKGQQKLAGARVVIVGGGALGGTAAEQLARSGVRHLTIIDRDIVELSNLQRQVLFDEEDARANLPKAVAAERRLRRINSSIQIRGVVADLNGENAEELLDADLILDATDNVETRYLINDFSVKTGTPWLYTGCAGTAGRGMAIPPGKSVCLRCL